MQTIQDKGERKRENWICSGHKCTRNCLFSEDVPLTKILFSEENDKGVQLLRHLPEQPSTTKYFLSISYTGLWNKNADV